MRIAFLCSSLEPGRDGVGDYSRMLADECLRLGHPAAIVALNDRHVVAASVEEAGAVPRLRLGAGSPWRERMKRTRGFVDGFAADWISLQFVGYGYHPKGIPFRLSGQLLPLIRGRSMHVMFHELWIGNGRGEPWKERAIGMLQRWCVVHLLRRLGPTRVTTSNSTYGAILRTRAIEASVLPLFGTVPVVERPATDWVYEEVKNAVPAVAPREDVWVFAMFGALHPVWPCEPLLTYLRAAARVHRKTVVIASMGRLGPGEALWQKMSADSAEPLYFLRFGEQPAARVSEFLHLADFAIATSPWDLIGKSASVACMLDHGLPVIVNRPGSPINEVAGIKASDPFLVKMDAQLPTRIAGLKKRPARSSLPSVTQEFLRLLQESSTTLFPNFLTDHGRARPI